MTDRQTYVRMVLNLYAQMRDIACPPRRSDRRLAGCLFDRQVPITIVEAALLLGSARRLCHRGARALEAIRSLHYFEAIVEELIARPLPTGYLDYLRLKVQATAQLHTPVSQDQRA